MKFHYLCSYHACLMQCSEEEALRYWTETRRRGVAAFDQCRWDAARNYLGMAHEIALLRSAVQNNRYFHVAHILQPLERLVEMALAENACEVVDQLIDATHTAMDSANPDWQIAVREPLQQYQRRMRSLLAANARRQISFNESGIFH